MFGSLIGPHIILCSSDLWPFNTRRVVATYSRVIPGVYLALFPTSRDVPEVPAHRPLPVKRAGAQTLTNLY